MLDLDTVYKSKLPDSHEAGLQAVYDFALAQAAQAFVSSVQAPEAPVADTVQAPTGA
jgi:hypothetical protein